MRHQSTSASKGKQLEYAVHQIEEAILAHNPAFAGAQGTIEPNKIVPVGGSRHEIDLWIALHAGTHHEFIHIVECKNWKKPVGTKEVLALAGKREEVGAHAASLITTRISKDAAALAKRHGIYVALVTNFPLLEIAAPLISHRVEGGEVAVTYRRQDPGAPAKLSLDNQCVLDGTPTTLSEVTEWMIGKDLQEATRKDPRKGLPGTHVGTTSFRHPLAPGRLSVDARDVAVVGGTIQYSAEVYFPTIEIKLAVEGRGGFCKLQYPPGAYDGKDLALEIVTKPVVPAAAGRGAQPR